MYKPVSSKVDLPAQENATLHFWEDEQIFEKLVAQNRGNPRFSFFDGPITANNPMGVHHAWGRTYKDLYQRFKAMQGFDQRYQNGFDCQGLWVEVEVEKALGLNSKRQIEEYGLQRFVEQCRDRVLTYAGFITRQSIRLGQWMDWGNSYFTMSDNNIEHIWFFLKRCFENGWLYTGRRAMPWCPRCGTSLSQHELIGTDSYRDVVHPSVYVKMPILGRDDEHFLVWTTTPWTLAANVALAVHPDLEYARVRTDDGILYLSAKTLGRLKGAHQVLDVRLGRDLIGWRYRGPWDELDAQEGIDHQVIPWNDVGEDEGTGIVHIAPGCGAEDFTLGQSLGLPVVVPIDEGGLYYPEFGPLAGVHAHDAAELVFGSLRQKNLLYRVEEIEHRYPCCWRCGEQVLFRAVSEWFINCDEIRPRMIEASRTVVWNPPSVGKRMEDWLNNMGDWCISRKRYWGLPLPFYPCPTCEQLTVVGSVDELRAVAVSGMDGLQELHRPWIDSVRIKCPNCGSAVERITEVGDCWLDAGIVPFSTLGPGFLKDRDEWARWYPAEWITEMREQVRLWFYSMLFMSVTLEGRAPYQHVLSYEKLMDEHGKPMHKSLGNAIWFEDAAEKMGADVMRWLYAGQNPQRNLLFGYGPAEEVRRKLLTLWNVYSFFVTYAESDGWHPLHSPRGIQSKMDRWILGQLDALVSTTNASLNSYDAPSVVGRVDAFVDDLSNWYLRRGRRRFAAEAEPDDRNAAFATLHECMVTLARLLAPFLPFLAEEIYQNLVRSLDQSAPESVHLTRYPQPSVSRADEGLALEMELARNIVTLGRSARSDAGIPVRQPLPALTIAGELFGVELSEEVLAEIEDELNIKDCRLVEGIDSLARRIVHPNPRVLGPKLGPRFPEVNRALREGEYTINPDGTVTAAGHILGAEEVTISLEPLEDQTLVQHSGGGAGPSEGDGRHGWRAALAVALDRRISPELRAEGIAREVIRRVQMLRRDAGLQVGDRIRLGLDLAPELGRMVQEHRERIRTEVGADTVSGEAASTGHVWRGDLDGYAVALSVEPVG